MDEFDRELYSRTPEGRAYIEYFEATGGDPIGLIVPIGYPDGVEEMGGPEAVYRECIRKGVTWEDLLGYHPDENAEI